MLSIKEILVSLGIISDQINTKDQAVIIVLIISLAFISDFVCKKIALIFLHIHAKLTNRPQEEDPLKKKVIEKFASLIPALIFNIFLPLFFEKGETLFVWVGKACSIYILITIVSFIFSILDFVYGRYIQKKGIKIAINIIVQIVKLALGFIAVIITFSILMGKSPTTLLTGIGASAAVLSFIFKDTLVSLLSSFQLTGNKMLNIGDWITAPKHNIDGIVKEITLNTIKIQNFDNTIITIPPQTLVSESFQNWNGMQQSTGRRIKRAVYIDMASIKFCDETMLERFKQNSLVNNYLSSHLSPESGTQKFTNIGIFRNYLEAYIKTIPTFNNELTHMIRQLAPTEKGLPVEIYFFSTEKRWEEYEMIQADLFDHILAIIPFFELNVFQNPTGLDFHKGV
ncbi:MAG: mechanosensitive ion channel [Bacteroidales bacterium]|nr:mechanosensitive ion channel [Bacteroidales bacterium]